MQFRQGLVVIVDLIANQDHRICMMGFLQREKNHCKLCNLRFDKQEELVQHAKKVHHQPITRCRNCGMEFLHEEDRLHHVKQEKERKTDIRRHR